MLNLSSILKKYKQRKLQLDSENKVNDEILEEIGLGDEDNKKVKISSLVKKELPDEDNPKEAQIVYAELLAKARDIYHANFSYKPGLGKDINSLIDKLIKHFSAGHNGLLKIVLQDYPNNQDYLSSHVVNTCVISVIVGLSLGFDAARLLDLGVAAFLHDLGIIKYLDLIYQKKILHEEEYAKVKKHPNTSLEILKEAQGEIAQDIIDAIGQEHERLDGSGYPQGLKDKQISEVAQIIGLADLYEAMVHQRPYRNKFSPLETVKLILNNKGAFDSRMIKALIEKIGIFPVGVSVRLNTKETGSVVKENSRLPLRPIVNVFFDAAGKELKEPKRIDLSVNPMIFIAECLESFGAPHKNENTF
jgi:HD-GYP domain-containing protein (c-di-GMP phosphodiesterase class II)